MKRLIVLSFLLSIITFNLEAQQLNCVDNSLVNLSLNSALVDTVWGCDGNCYENDTLAIYHNGVTHYTYDACNVTLPPCHADFYTSDDISGFVNFTDSGIVSAFTPMYLLDFGDGQVSTSIPTTHQYSNPGFHVVCLTMYDMLGTTLMCESKSCRVVLSPGGGGCVAMFTASTNCGVTTFADQSTGTYTTVQWDFGDGTTGTTSPGDTTYEYAASGTYIVHMNILGGGTCNSAYTDTITVDLPTVTAAFTYVASGNSAHTVNFTNTSTGATSYYWDLGDGDTASASNPVHDYDTCSYTVTLTAFDGNGCTSISTMLIDACDNAVPTFNSVLNSMTVYPNPAKDNIKITMNSRKSSSVIVTIKDVTGRDVIESTPLHVNAGKNNFNFNLPVLPAGVYMIQVSDDFGMMNARVLIK